MAIFLYSENNFLAYEFGETLSSAIRAEFLVIADETDVILDVTIEHGNGDTENYNLPFVTTIDGKHYYSLPYKTFVSIDLTAQGPTGDEPTPTPSLTMIEYPSRIYLEVSDESQTINHTFAGYYTKRTSAKNFEHLEDSTGETYFEYYENDNLSSRVIVLDVTESNYNTGIVDKHHVLFSLSDSMPYAQSGSGGGPENLVTSFGASWGGEINILLESEVLPTPTPSPVPDQQFPNTIYIGRQESVTSETITDAMIGEFTYQGFVDYYSSQMMYAHTYENSSGYQFWLYAWSSSEYDPPYASYGSHTLQYPNNGGGIDQSATDGQFHPYFTSDGAEYTLITVCRTAEECLAAIPTPTPSPMLFPNPVTWFDASSEDNVVVNEDGYITQFIDKSGNNNHANFKSGSTPEANVIPYELNTNLSVANFGNDPQNNNIFEFEYVPLAENKVSMVYVFVPDIISSFSVFGNGSVAAQDMNYDLHNNVRYPNNFRNARAVPGITPLNPITSDICMMTIISNGISDTYEVRVNGVTEFIQTADSNDNYTFINGVKFLGGGYGGKIHGKFCEALFLNETDTTTIKDVEMYLADKWGISYPSPTPSPSHTPSPTLTPTITSDNEHLFDPTPTPSPTPNPFPNPVTWFDAGSSENIVVNNDNFITQFTDKSGNNNHAVFKPGILNTISEPSTQLIYEEVTPNLYSAKFAPAQSANVFQFIDLVPLSENKVSMIYVFKPNSPNNISCFGSKLNTQNYDLHLGNTWMHHYRTVRQKVPGAQQTTDIIMMTVISDGTANKFEVRRNGISAYNSNEDFEFRNDVKILGGEHAAKLNGHFCEVLFFDETDYETIISAEMYLAEKWGVSYPSPTPSPLS